MKPAAILSVALLLSGCANSLRPADLTRPAPTTLTELNRALYAQMVDLAWDDGSLVAGAVAVVVGQDSVRYVSSQSNTVHARAARALVRIDARAVGKNRRAAPFLGAVAAGVITSRLLSRAGAVGPLQFGLTLGAFGTGAVIGDKLGGALAPTRRVVLYERDRTGPLSPVPSP